MDCERIEYIKFCSKTQLRLPQLTSTEISNIGELPGVVSHYIFQRKLEMTSVEYSAKSKNRDAEVVNLYRNLAWRLHAFHRNPIRKLPSHLK